MNRTAVIALVVAAVLGTAGGVTLASLTGSPDGTPASSPSPGRHGGATRAPSGSAPTASPSPEPTNEPLLYATDTEIHDGKKVVPINGPHNVGNINRVSGGYLVMARSDPNESAFHTAWLIRPSGEARRIADVSGRTDVDADGKRLVGVTRDTSRTTVWSLPDGKVLARLGEENVPPGQPSFAGHDVLISHLTTDAFGLLRWNPETGTTSGTGTVGYADMSISPGGSYMTGSVEKEGVSSSEGANPCIALTSTYLKENYVQWQSCDWRPYGTSGQVQFSPDGMRVLVVPRATTDGFGPSEFAVIDASDGPDRIVAKFNTPRNTLGAKWADNDHLYVYGALGSDPDTSRVGSFVDRCDFKGACKRLVTDKGAVTVGSGL